MMKFLALILLSLIAGSAFAQLDSSKVYLKELEAGIYEKKFSKKWKKKKSQEWIKLVEGATNIETLNQQFNQFSDMLAQATYFSMGNSMATSELEMLEYLTSVSRVLKGNELVDNWNMEGGFDNWSSRINVEYEKQKLVKDEAKFAVFMSMSKIVKDVQANILGACNELLNDSLELISQKIIDDASFFAASSTKKLNKNKDGSEFLIEYSFDYGKDNIAKLLSQLKGEIEAELKSAYSIDYFKSNPYHMILRGIENEVELELQIGDSENKTIFIQIIGS